MPNYVPPIPPGLTATGGVISDYIDGPAVYRAHVFTSTGTFTVSALSTNPALPDSVEYLVVAGGGGGGFGNGQSGGAGAGGLRTNLSGHPLAGSAFPVSTSPGSYTVTVGGGGAGAGGPAGAYGTNGANSSFGPITSNGGGASVGYGVAPGVGNPGGSGGGAYNSPAGIAGGTGNTPPTSPPQGNPGGSSIPAVYGSPYAGGGGGGAGEAGCPDDPTSPLGRSTGGNGVQVSIAGPPTFTGVGALNPGPGEYQWFGGGGGGGGYAAAGAAGGVGGGGAGGSNANNPTKNGYSGTYSTGGGRGG